MKRKDLKNLVQKFLNQSKPWSKFFDEETMSTQFSVSDRPEHTLDVTNIGQPDEEEEDKKEEGIHNCNIPFGLFMDEAVIVPKKALEFFKNLFFRKLKNSPDIFGDLIDTFKPYKITFSFVKEDASENICLNSVFIEKTSEIFIFLNKKLLKNEISVSLDTLWKRISLSLGHELVHELQYYLRGFVKKVNNSDIKKELARKEEIMAYSWMSINLFLLLGYSKKEVLDILKNYNNRKRLDNTFLIHYYHYFNTKNREDIKTLNQFNKYCFEYVEKLYES